MILAVLVALSIVATWDTWQVIFQIGMRDEENSYVLLAPVIVVWLFLIRRERLRFCAPHWSLTGPCIVGLGWLSMWFGRNHGIEIAEQGGALLVVFGSGVTILGWKFVRAFLPAFIALLFLLPTPGRIRFAIAAPLETISAALTHSFLVTFGVPVFQNGNVLSINGHDVAVAEACNGMRMVVALALVTYAFVFSVPMRQWIRVVFLIMSPVIALVVNFIRLTPTVLMYGYSSKSSADAFHDISGWVMLGVALLILWGLQSLLKWLEIPIVPYSAGRPEYSS